jgi:hypothetical protein
VNRREPFLAFLRAGVVAGGAALVLAGCPSTATTAAYTPITGIIIRASSLVSGHGCGTGAGQVYKYAALLSYADEAGAPGAPVYSGVFDCFTDGIFSNLPSSDAGGLDFALTIYAWSHDAFPDALQCPADPNNPCPGDDPGTVLSNAGTPTWTTTCTATQQSGISVVAVCEPLASSSAPPGVDGGAPEASAQQGAISVDTHGFSLGDGGTLRCGPDFDSAHATFQAGSQGGQTSTVTCPAPLIIAPAAAGVTYSIVVQLIKAGSTVGQAACTAAGSTSASAPSIAQCQDATPQ